MSLVKLEVVTGYLCGVLWNLGSVLVLVRYIGVVPRYLGSVLIFSLVTTHELSPQFSLMFLKQNGKKSSENVSKN